MISGQHATEALRRRRADFLAKHLDVPPLYDEVLARILKHETPVAARQYAAGDSQAAQLAVEPLTIPAFGRLFLPGCACRLVRCSVGSEVHDRTALVC